MGAGASVDGTAEEEAQRRNTIPMVRGKGGNVNPLDSLAPFSLQRSVNVEIKLRKGTSRSKRWCVRTSSRASSKDPGRSMRIAAAHRANAAFVARGQRCVVSCMLLPLRALTKTHVLPPLLFVADLIATDSSEEQKEYAMKFEVTGPQPVIDACTALSLHADGHVSPVSPVRSCAAATPAFASAAHGHRSHVVCRGLTPPHSPRPDAPPPRVVVCVPDHAPSG